jgi:hypothetical protein
MPVWFVTGKLGSGKTLVSIGKIHDYLIAGRRVATNIDIDVDELFRKRKNFKKKFDFVRVPDKPSIENMNMLGLGYEGDSIDDNRTGLMVLDELATWFNTRNFRQDGRKELIDWFIHARKLRWDIILLVQNISLVDKQLIDSLCEYHVKCKRSDRLKFMGMTPPNWHVGEVFYNGIPETRKNRVEAWIYTGKRYYKAYDSHQVFSESYEDSPHCPLRKYQFQNIPPIEPSKFKKHINVKNFLFASMAIVNLFLVGRVIAASFDSIPLDNETVKLIESKKYTPPVPVLVEPQLKKSIIPTIFDDLGLITITGEIKIDSITQVLFESETAGSINKDQLKRLGLNVYKVTSCIYTLATSDYSKNVYCPIREATEI